VRCASNDTRVGDGAGIGGGLDVVGAGDDGACIVAQWLRPPIAFDAARL
jgi:hypothetical protein